MVEVVEKKSVWRSAKVWPVEGARPDDPVLAARLGDRGGEGAVGAGPGRAARQGARRDALRPAGRARHPRTPRRQGRWACSRARAGPPATPPTRKPYAAPRRPCSSTATSPTPRTGALVALLHAVDRAHKTVPHDGVSDREVKKRAKQVAEGQWAAKAVKDAIAAATAATMAAVTAATAGAAADVELAEVGDQLGGLLAPALVLPARCFSSRNPDSRTSSVVPPPSRSASSNSTVVTGSVGVGRLVTPAPHEAGRRPRPRARGSRRGTPCPRCSTRTRPVPPGGRRGSRTRWGTTAPSSAGIADRPPDAVDRVVELERSARWRRAGCRVGAGGVRVVHGFSSRWWVRRSRRSSQAAAYGARKSASCRSGSGSTSWIRSRPRRVTVIRPAAARTSRCLVTPWRVIGRPSRERAQGRRPGGAQLLEQAAPDRVGERVEDGGLHVVDIRQLFGCMSTHRWSRCEEGQRRAGRGRRRTPPGSTTGCPSATTPRCATRASSSSWCSWSRSRDHAVATRDTRGTRGGGQVGDGDVEHVHATMLTGKWLVVTGHFSLISTGHHGPPLVARPPGPRQRDAAAQPAGRPRSATSSRPAPPRSATACRAAARSRPTSASRGPSPSRPTTSCSPRGGSRARQGSGTYVAASGIRRTARRRPATAPRLATPPVEARHRDPVDRPAALRRPGEGPGARCPRRHRREEYDDPRGLPELRDRARGAPGADPRPRRRSRRAAGHGRHRGRTAPPAAPPCRRGAIAVEDPGYRAAVATVRSEPAREVRDLPALRPVTTLERRRGRIRHARLTSTRSASSCRAATG